MCFACEYSCIMHDPLSWGLYLSCLIWNGNFSPAFFTKLVLGCLLGAAKDTLGKEKVMV